MFSKFSPPPSQKVLQNHFQVILSDLSLDAPGRPCTPLRPCVKTRFAWRARAQGRVTPPFMISKKISDLKHINFEISTALQFEGLV